MPDSSSAGRYSTKWWVKCISDCIARDEGVLTQEQVAVDGVAREVFLEVIVIETEKLLPADHREGGIQSVEIGYLNVAAVLILLHFATKGNALRKVIAFGVCACGDCEDGQKRIVNEVYAHADIYERNPGRFQGLDDDLSRTTQVYRYEYEGHV